MSYLPIDDLVVDFINSVRPLIFVHCGVCSIPDPDCLFKPTVVLLRMLGSWSMTFASCLPNYVICFGCMFCCSRFEWFSGGCFLLRCGIEFWIDLVSFWVCLANLVDKRCSISLMYVFGQHTLIKKVALIFVLLAQIFYKGFWLTLHITKVNGWLHPKLRC